MNSIHYYPYASFRDSQLPLLNASALYFDKLHILDPNQASWDSLGAVHAFEEVAFLRKKKILQPIDPADVLKKYEPQITASIRADMNDPEFLKICDDYGKKKRWTLALAKVPKEIREDPKYQPVDQAMRNLMGDFTREMSVTAGQYQEEYLEYAETIETYNESYESYEYRFADYPLALGESIMINHAIFAGLLHAGATPITDNTFHKRILEYKIKKASQLPEIREVLEDRFHSPQLKKDFFAQYLLTDKQIDIPALASGIPIEEIYKYREKHKNSLGQLRRKMGQLSRKIIDLPLTSDFEKEVDVAMSSLDKELEELEKQRDSWLKDKKVKIGLSAAGIAAGAASSTLSVILSATPLAPIGLVIAGLGLVNSAVIPGFEKYLDLKKGNRDSLGNGLHYLLQGK